MNNNKGFITLTVVFEAMSLNRDEGLGNIQTLHMLTRGDGTAYSYMSRQALTYAVRKFLIESGEWERTEVKIASGNVTQFDSNISTSQEIDLFGYMKTTSSSEGSDGSADVRPTAVTFTHAVSMEPYGGNVAFYANPEMAKRSNSNPNPYNRQEHRSFYKYSVVIDLNRISKKDGEDKQDKKAAEERLSQLLDAIASLHHQIAGYRESLAPLFIAAAHLKFGSPIFHNYVQLSEVEKEKNKLNGKLFGAGISHADLILKNENMKSKWAILEGSGDLHLSMTDNNISTGGDTSLFSVITEVKSWVSNIYK